MLIRILLPAAIILASPARAEIVKSTDNGFIVQQSVAIARDKATVFVSMTSQVGKWWNPDHSFSGDADNMLIDNECFCERWGNNLVRHLNTEIWMGNSKVVMVGGLGPLKELGLSGTMIWSLVPGDEGSTLVNWKYHVYGYSETVITDLAVAVDGVLKEQIDRLAAYMEPEVSEE